MNVEELAHNLCLQQLTGITRLSGRVSSGCACDLLSHVLANGRAGTAWITVQTHVSIIAIARLRGFACIIVPDCVHVPDDVLREANARSVPVFSSELSAYRICWIMGSLGIG